MTWRCGCCRTPGDKFQKEYAYNIRYNYGQEGKRENWSEWSCVKTISQVRLSSCGRIGKQQWQQKLLLLMKAFIDEFTAAC